MAITTTDVVAEYGAYYMKGSQNERSLSSQLFHSDEWNDDFTRNEGDDTVLRYGTTTQSRIVQAFKTKWSPTGDTTFKPQPINLFEFKVDIEVVPDKLEQTWLGFLASNNLDRKQWPFVKWLMQGQLLPKMAEDHVLYEDWDGVFATPADDNVAAAAGTASNGLKFLRNTHIDDGVVTPIVTGALSTTAMTLVGQIEDFVKQIDIRDRSSKLTLNMGIEQRDLFREGMLEKYNMNYAQVDNLDRVRLHPNVMVKGRVSMGTTDAIWASPKWNNIDAIKKSGNMQRFNVENVDRTVKIYTDYYRGRGWWDVRRLYTNDQDIALPV